jgi:aminoglycoside 3-N-acetyltransferase
MVEKAVAVRTRASLGEDLRDLGVLPGNTLLVHASLKSLGYVVGGATAVVQAVLDVLGPDGTLVVPAQTATNRDPSTWDDPAFPEELWAVIRDNLPGFDPDLTPSHAMGRIAEQVRTWPGARRSDHPQTSFAAVGPRARFLMADHRLTSPLGEHSPLARLEELDARVLLLGVGWESSTVFHLGEYRIPGALTRMNGCAVVGPRGREWVEYPGIRLHDHDFGQLGKSLENETPGVVVSGTVGDAFCRLFPVRPAVHFATSWLLDNRKLKPDHPGPHPVFARH